MYTLKSPLYRSCDLSIKGWYIPLWRWCWYIHIVVQLTNILSLFPLLPPLPPSLSPPPPHLPPPPDPPSLTRLLFCLWHFETVFSSYVHLSFLHKSTFNLCLMWSGTNAILPWQHKPEGNSPHFDSHFVSWITYINSRKSDHVELYVPTCVHILPKYNM